MSDVRPVPAEPAPEDEEILGPRGFSDPKEALRHALSKPPQEIRPVEGIEPEMWEAFHKALARQ
jgi:hypothetical protein